MPTDVKNNSINDTTLTLFIPDLFGLQPYLSQLSQTEQPRLTVIEKWLSRGTRETVVSQDDIIFSELGITSETFKHKPVSAFSLLAESTILATKDQSYWLRADPVSIQPDRDTVVLMAHEEIDLSMEEATKLVNEINTHFVDEPWELHAVHPQRWYLRLDKAHDLVTTPLTQVLSRDINSFLPRGEHASYWQKCINEIQMLLHGTNVNFERESRGLLTVNSLWLWGGGVLPTDKNMGCHYTHIISDDILLQGIARYYGIDRSAIEQFEKAILAGKTFMLLDSLSEPVARQDVFSYVQKLAEIESNYLERIDELLKQGKLKQVRLLSDKMSVSVTTKSLRRWWKRRKDFAEL